MSKRRTCLLAIVCVGLAYAAPVSDIGWNQGSHYALVRAIWRGSPHIDRDRWLTGDVAFARGHFYSTKAPGLALASLPPYALLRATAMDEVIMRHSSSRRRAARATIWGLSFVAVVVPAMTLLMLVASAGERIEPGWGLAAAMTLGLGTLMLPFATLFFAHVLSALLGFAAFVLLWREREEREHVLLVASAGLVLGLAVTTEYSLAVLTLPLGAYALIRTRHRVRRAFAFAIGLAVGVAPLLLYNWWAFGSPLHVSYEDAVSVPGSTGHDVLGANTTGLFGEGAPSPRVAAELLFASRGLLTLSPVLVMASVGVVHMFRRGKRAEALVIGTVACSLVVFNAGYFLPFGGWTAGPRFLIPTLPFLGVALAPAYRWSFGPTLALAVASTVIFVTATATQPLLPTADISTWVERARSGLFRDTMVTGLGSTPGWLTVIVFVAPIGAAIVLAVSTAPRVRLSQRDAAVSLGLLAVWVVAAGLAPRVGAVPGVGAAVLVLVAGAVAACVVVLLTLLGGSTRRVPVADPPASFHR